jgi:hypothetical protein
LPLYAINSDAVGLFADSSFTFLAKLNMWLYLMYSVDLNEWMSFYLCQKKYENDDSRFFAIIVWEWDVFRRYITKTKCWYPPFIIFVIIEHLQK